MFDFYKSHPYWINRDPEVDEDKVLRRAIIAQLFTANDQELSTWPESREWNSLKTRLCVLMDILEELGCFVLRKGAIESYYAFTSNETYNGKPSAAVLEVSNLHTISDEAIEAQYDDTIRSLKYAALDKTVDESFAVKKELLRVCFKTSILPNHSPQKGKYQEENRKISPVFQAFQAQ